ncbi:hypothetical protein BXZ70DRAFT_930357 [Cristinia sonorae]|uniref:DUF4470 domain-containing protein n=1 Tax=Cristinia sonorae TaxID=1940300 RepID=A0A8K0XR62_9AGAR|nr:hypothetical protein BXZ70DRAFT_930357 [Cristinia sonorae]
MAPETAKTFKAEGNEHFKAGRHGQAATLFAKAESLDPTDPVYPSNLSAALYENGQYTESVKAIIRSWLLLKKAVDPKPDFVVRLFARLGKALAQGIAGRSVDEAFLEENQMGIESLKHAVAKLALKTPEDEALVESVRAWPDLLDLNSQVENRDGVVKEWLGRLSRIPMVKKPPTPGMNYWGMGMDDVFSILRGFPGFSRPMNLKTLPISRLSSLSFLYGGVGDGRHVYTTIIDLHHEWKKLPKDKGDALFTHITMLDIHPAMLARDMIILSLARQLGDEGLEPTDRLEIKAACVYLWNGIALPSYCAERVRNVMQDLRDRLTDSPPSLPKWLVVAPTSLPGILQHIMLWLTVRPEAVGPVLDRHESQSMETHLWNSINDETAPRSYRQMALENLGNMRKKMSDDLKSWPVHGMKKSGFIDEDVPDKEAKRIWKERHNEFVDRLMEIEMLGGPEDVWYSALKTYMPPPELRSRHPAFNEIAQGLHGKTGKDFDMKLLRVAEKGIRATWETNRTLFAIDPVTKWAEPGYPDRLTSVLSTFKKLYDFVNSVTPGGYPELTALADSYKFTLAMDFFDYLGKAIVGLQGHLRVESVAGDLNGEMCKIWLGSDARPKEYPRKFTRAWLSNVPDYTGGVLNTAVYVVPQTDGSPDSMVANNSYAATAAFKEMPDYDNQFCHTYTLLPLNDLPRYLGVKAVGTEAVFHSLVLASVPLPRPIHDLASRSELTTWLTRLLVNIMIPGTSQMAPNRCTLPNNMAAFLGLLCHLHRVGFPGHWLADYLQLVLTGSMVTDIAPYEKEWPIPLEDMKRRVKPRKVRFDPWLPDFENILAESHEGLPFAITLPPDFARTPDELGTYSCRMSINNPLLRDMFHPRDPNMVLLFYKKQPNLSETFISTRLNAIFHNHAQFDPPRHKIPPPGDVFVLTVVEAFDREGEVRWKMSKKRAQEMMDSDGQWLVVGSRSSTFMCPETVAVSSNKWRVL